MSTDEVKRAFAEYNSAMSRLSDAARHRTRALEDLHDACARLKDACADVKILLEKAHIACVSSIRAIQNTQK